MRRRALLVVWALAGCASSPPPHLYELSGPFAGSARLDVAVDVGVNVPEYLDRPQVVIRDRASGIRIDDANRWVAPLPEVLASAIKANLTNPLGFDRVAASRTDRRASFRVQVDLQRMDSAPGSFTTLAASWSVRRLKDGRTLRGDTNLLQSVDSPGYEALVQAHARAVARLSADIAAAIRELNAESEGT